MPLPQNPATNTSSPFASMRGHHTGDPLPRLRGARAFWVDTLDWRVLQTWPYGELTLAYVMPPEPGRLPPGDPRRPRCGAPRPIYADVDASLVVNGFNHVCLSVESVDDTLAELRARGVDIVNPPFEIDDISARLAFFRDPWGNMFELSERTGEHAHRSGGRVRPTSGTTEPQ